MKLLFDQNLPPRLAIDLADLFPDSAHVRALGLASADDDVVWARAAESGYVIVTKDDDFRQRSFLRGPPPQVVWVRTGNCTSTLLVTLLRSRASDILAFGSDQNAGLLVLTRPA